MKSKALNPPADLRFLERAAPNPSGESAEAKVYSLLESLYESVAETMPDFGGQVEKVVETTLQHGDHEPVDPYAVAAGCAADIPFVVKAKKIRNIKSVKTDRQVLDQEVRYLPPGATMRDYWDQMVVVHGESVSFSTFWRAS